MNISHNTATATYATNFVNDSKRVVIYIKQPNIQTQPKQLKLQYQRGFHY